MKGGRSYGEGVYGKALDAVEVPGDADTLFADLSALEPAELGRCYAWPPEGAPEGSRKKLSASQMRAIVASLSSGSRRGNGASLIAKRISSREAFLKEMRSLTAVRKAYSSGGKDGVAEFTTIGSLVLQGVGEVAALETPRASYVFSVRCDQALDKFDFGTTADVRAFVRDVLRSFARLHAGGAAHCDVKLDNMIRCSGSSGARSSSKGARFKLIDWGGSDTLEDLVVRYTQGVHLPKNTGSPFAWAAWGVGPALPAFQLGYAVWWYSYDAASCPAFAALLNSSHASFERAYVSMRRAFFSRGLKGAQDGEREFRAEVVRRYARSFDLYSLGLVFAHVACLNRPGVSEATRTSLMRLARVMTHYDDPDFCQDAADLLRRFLGKGS